MIKDQRGGIGILLLVLLSISMSVIILAVTFSINTQTNTIERVKRHLALAVHAATLDEDKNALSDGILKLDLTKARNSFDQFIIKNMRVVKMSDTEYTPQSNSYLSNTVKLHLFEFINTGPFPKTYSKSIVINAGTPKEATRKIDELLVGPSIVSVIEVTQDSIGSLDDEPIIIANAQEVRFRLKP